MKEEAHESPEQSWGGAELRDSGCRAALTQGAPTKAAWGMDAGLRTVLVHRHMGSLSTAVGQGLRWGHAGESGLLAVVALYMGARRTSSGQGSCLGQGRVVAALQTPVPGTQGKRWGWHKS